MSKRRLVITAVLAGQSQSEVARTYGVSQGWVSRVLARYRVEGEAAFEPLSRHPRVQHARRQGMVFAWDVQSNLPDFARRYARHALDQGLVLRPIGHTLYAMPPYVIDEEAGAFLARGALAALQATLQEEHQGLAPVEAVCDGV